MKFFAILLCFTTVCGLAACSPIQQRIIGGNAASANQFPYQVAVRIPTGPTTTATCGGSIISPLWVLTAAHCVANTKQVNLRLGSINRNSGGIFVASFKIFRHPGFNPFNFNNDIAVIKLPSPLTFVTAAIQPIRLPTLSQMANSFVGVRATVSGWGETYPNSGVQTMLRWVDTRIISNAECTSSFNSDFVVGHVVCTVGHARPSNGICRGDSGSPLVIQEAGAYTQIGVVSFVNHSDRGGCATDHPSGYMRTTHFLQWIMSIIGGQYRP